MPHSTGAFISSYVMPSQAYCGACPAGWLTDVEQVFDLIVDLSTCQRCEAEGTLPAKRNSLP